MPPTCLSLCPSVSLCLSLSLLLCLSHCLSISVAVSLSLRPCLSQLSPSPSLWEWGPQVGQEAPPGGSSPCRRGAQPREGCAGWSTGPMGTPGPCSAAARLSRAPLGRLSCGVFWALGFENILKTLGYPNNMSKALLFSAVKVERLLSEREPQSQVAPSQGKSMGRMGRFPEWASPMPASATRRWAP